MSPTNAFCRVLPVRHESGKRPQEVPLGDAREFAAFANAAASLCCEKYGAIPALPTPEDVLERF